MRAEAATALSHMFADAQAAGYTLVADSGYRSHDYQVTVYNGYVKQWGQDYTDTISARPGYSEHQTGWAVDIGTGSCHVEDCFADTPGGKWAQANAYKYGFLLRYPETLTNVTGYSHEAWHFRYVGPLLSNELHTENIQTLEQFFGISGGTTYK
jgi:D-alanyl-D-alanine carboxypeptidase